MLHAFSHILYIQVNDSECNSIELSVTGSGHTVKGYAVFDGPTLTGRVTFVGSYNITSRILLILFSPALTNEEYLSFPGQIYLYKHHNH